MARLFTAGNELAQPTHEGWFWDETQVYPSITQRGGYRSTEQNGGDYYYYLPQNWDLVHFPGTFGKPANWPTTPAAEPHAELYVRFHYYPHAYVSGERTILSFIGGDGTPFYSVSAYDVGGGTVSGGPYGFRYRTGQNGGIIHSTGSIGANNVWRLVEARLKLGGGGSGVLEIRVDGVIVGSSAGVFLGPLGEASMAGIHMRNTQISGATQINCYDDFAVNDATGTINNTWPGDGYVVLRMPHRDGATTELATDVDAGGVDNADRIGVADIQNRSGLDRLTEGRGRDSGGDDRLFRPGGFVTPTAVPQKDTYTIKELPFDAGAVSAVSVYSRGIGRGPLAGNVKHLLKPPAQAEIASAAIPLNTIEKASYATHLDANPNTGVAFTVTELNAMEIGVQFEA